MLKSIFCVALALVALGRQADACGSIMCWDECSNSSVMVYGDVCATNWNPGSDCSNAYGICNQNSCGAVQCYDYCSHRYITFGGANTCLQVWDSIRNCSSALAKCN